MFKKIFSNFVLKYFRYLAKLQLKKNPQAIIIGITGSSGKTSTRLAISTILSHKGRVKHSIHANSESGIPLNILGLSTQNYRLLDWLRLILLAPFKLLFNWEKYDYYIVEMGIDSPRAPKNMEYLLTIIRPDIAVILNAGLVHSAEFDYLVADRNPVRRSSKIRLEIAKEKMKLAYSIPPNGFTVINADQKELKLLSNKIKSRKMTIGSSVGSNLRILSLSNRSGFTLTFVYQTQKYRLHLAELYEDSYAYTFMSAIAVAAGIGIRPAQSIEYLKSYLAPRGRLRLFEGIHGTHLIDSSYNASPDTMKSALAFLKKVAGKKHKVAIIGDMRELGLQTKPAHKLLADWLRTSTDECLLFGPNTQEFTLPVLERAAFPVHHFVTMAKLLSYLDQHLVKNSWILIKGSQNSLYLERVVEHLLADKKNVVKLPRRGKYWDHLRAKSA